MEQKVSSSEIVTCVSAQVSQDKDITFVSLTAGNSRQKRPFGILNAAGSQLWEDLISDIEQILVWGEG